MEHYNATIDYLDVIETEMIKLINEQVLYIENDYIKEAYQYEYIIQVNLSTVNGVTLRNHAN